jgi:ribonuclease BN (tRNA processing enzyme)
LSTHARVAVLGFLVALVIAMWVFAFLSKHFEKVAAGVAALPPAEFEELTLLALGTGGTFENHLRRGPALAVALGGNVVLVDAGRGVAEALRAAAVPVEQPRLLLLSSLAEENVIGVDDLWLTGWLRGRAAPLVVYGPPGTQAFVDGLVRAFTAQADAQAAAWSLPAAGRPIEAHDVVFPTEVTAGALTAKGAPLPGGSLPALAWRIEGGGFAVAFTFGSPDGRPLTAAARGADFWVTEAVYGASLERAREAFGAEGLEVLLREAHAHPLLEALGPLAVEAGVRSLVLVRLRPPPPFASQYESVVEEGGFRGNVHVPDDGDRLVP